MERIEYELPEGCKAATTIVVAQYFDTDGEIAYYMQVEGVQNTYSVVGMLEMAKHRLIEQSS